MRSATGRVIPASDDAPMRRPAAPGGAARPAPAIDPASPAAVALARAQSPLAAAVAPVLVDLAQMPADELLEHLARISASLNAVAAEVTARVRRLELATRDAALAARMAVPLSCAEAARELGICRETASRWSSARGGMVRVDMHGKAPRAAWEEAWQTIRMHRRGKNPGPKKTSEPGAL